MIKKLFTTTLAGLMLIGCDDFECCIPSVISVDESAVTVGGLTGDVSTPPINVNCALDWTAQDVPTGLIAVISGTTLTFKATADYLDAARTFKVTLLAANGDKTMVTVTQTSLIRVTEVKFADAGLTMTYGDAPLTLTPDVTPVNATHANLSWSSSDNTIVEVNASGVATALKSGSVTITASATDGSGVSGSIAITVNKKTLTVTADDQIRPAGVDNPALTVSYSGFVNGDVAASLTTQPVASTTATAASPLGSYTITVSGGVSDHYSFDYVSGTLWVAVAYGKSDNFTGIGFGTDLPPATVLGVDLIPVDIPNTIPEMGPISSLMSPLGTISFSPTGVKYVIGSIWGTWSHGYTGSVIAFEFIETVTITLPAGTTMFRFSVEPNVYENHPADVKADGEAVVGSGVEGSSGAACFVIIADPGKTIGLVTITLPDSAGGFAVGEFAISGELPISTSAATGTLISAFKTSVQYLYMPNQNSNLKNASNTDI